MFLPRFLFAMVFPSRVLLSALGSLHWVCFSLSRTCKKGKKTHRAHRMSPLNKRTLSGPQKVLVSGQAGKGPQLYRTRRVYLILVSGNPFPRDLQTKIQKDTTPLEWPFHLACSLSQPLNTSLVFFRLAHRFQVLTSSFRSLDGLVQRRRKGLMGIHRADSG